VSPRFSLRRFSARGRWPFVLRVALSGPSRCCHRPVSGPRVPGPSRPGPPRCCAGLRRLTTHRSRSFGFPAPPAPLPPGWTLASSGGSPTPLLPVESGIPPMTLQSPSRTSLACRPFAPGGRRRPSLRSGPPPVGFVAPSALLTRGIHFPVRRVPPGSAGGSHRRSAPVVPARLALRWTAAPRRGVPIPLRSTSAVSRDPGGLLLLGLCGVFQPLTPMGFPSLLPDACLPVAGPEDHTSRGRARVMRTEVRVTRNTGGERSCRRLLVDSAPGQLPKHPSRPEATAPISEEMIPAPAPHTVSRPSPGPDHRSGHSSGQPVPVPPRPKSWSPGPPRRRTVAAFRPFPDVGLPLLRAPMSA
jgi:hypothetical protein